MVFEAVDSDSTNSFFWSLLQKLLRITDAAICPQSLMILRETGVISWQLSSTIALSLSTNASGATLSWNSGSKVSAIKNSPCHRNDRETILSWIFSHESYRKIGLCGDNLPCMTKVRDSSACCSSFISASSSFACWSDVLTVLPWVFFLWPDCFSTSSPCDEFSCISSPGAEVVLSDASVVGFVSIWTTCERNATYDKVRQDEEIQLIDSRHKVLIVSLVSC